MIVRIYRFILKFKNSSQIRDLTLDAPYDVLNDKLYELTYLMSGLISLCSNKPKKRTKWWKIMRVNGTDERYFDRNFTANVMIFVTLIADIYRTVNFLSTNERYKQTTNIHRTIHDHRKYSKFNEFNWTIISSDTNHSFRLIYMFSCLFDVITSFSISWHGKQSASIFMLHAITKRAEGKERTTANKSNSISDRLIIFRRKNLYP